MAFVDCPLSVIAGLDPAIQGPPRTALAALDARVKPGHDRKGNLGFVPDLHSGQAQWRSSP
ncbi:hypothetical protein FFK22_022765 [Mycobacterium sp. KBS0706]|nr:hypothetical protein FFK22_022765 [Mycobacterium sp. KBS0706]